MAYGNEALAHQVGMSFIISNMNYRQAKWVIHVLKT